MIETKVRVVSRHNGELLVTSTESSGCGGCSSRNVCGISGLAKYFAGGRKPVAVSCSANVQPGQELSMQMQEGDLLKAGVMAYLVPSLFAIGGAALVTQAGYGDAWSVLGALGGVLLGLLLIRVFRWKPSFTATSTHSIQEGDTP